MGEYYRERNLFINWYCNAPRNAQSPLQKNLQILNNAFIFISQHITIMSTDRFQNRYRVPSARLQNWDYGENSAYFITICTRNHECYFGDTMHLSEIGNIAKQYWDEIPNHFPFVQLGASVVMPNHVHGIIIINKTDDKIMPQNDVSDDMPPVETPNLGVSPSGNDNDLETVYDNDLETVHNNDLTTPNRIRTINASEKWASGTVGVIVNQYKRMCTITARKTHADFAWQSRFFDHIIRSNDSFQKISDYIMNNPKNWQEDKFYR